MLANRLRMKAPQMISYREAVSLLDVAPAIACNGIDFSNTGTYLALGIWGASPSLAVYKKNGSIYTKLNDPDVMPGEYTNDCKFIPNGTSEPVYLVVLSNTWPYINIYKRTGDAFSRLTGQPNSPTSNLVGRVALSPPNGDHMILCSNTETYLFGYKRVGDSFTPLDNPFVDQPNNGSRAVAYSPDGVHLACGSVGSAAGTLAIYKRNGDVYTKLTTVDYNPIQTINNLCFSPDGLYLAISYSVSPYVIVFKRNGDTFNKISDPSILPTGYGSGIAFSRDSRYLALGHENTPFFIMYRISENNLIKADGYDGLHPARPNYIEFSDDGKYMATTSAGAPFIHFYK